MAEAVILGKFMPLHKGHELMINMALAEFSHVTIIVSSSAWKPDKKTPGLEERYKIIKKKYEPYNVTVVKHVDLSPTINEMDEHGTVINNEPFWDYWVETVHKIATRATHLVSSDRYGGDLVRRINLRYKTNMKWVPVDPDRELVPVSATDIRKDPFKNWKYISEEFRRFYALKIVVMGPESTGKSTLVKDLAKYWRSGYVPEYGRILSEAQNNNLTVQNFIDIKNRHYEMIEQAIKMSDTGIVFIDTEAFTTFQFLAEYLGLEERENGNAAIKLVAEANASKFDKYILLPPVIPWDDDGTRVMPDKTRREKFYEELEDFLKERERPYHVVTSLGREERVREVSCLLPELVGQDNITVDKIDWPSYITCEK